MGVDVRYPLVLIPIHCPPDLDDFYLLDSR